jgi:hypothetical protein
VDCRGLKNLIDGKSSPLSSIGGLCFDIIEIGRSFCEFHVEKANSAAHCCASMVSVTHRSYFWLDYFPEWLVGLAAADCNPIMI